MKFYIPFFLFSYSLFGSTLFDAHNCPTKELEELLEITHTNCYHTLRAIASTIQKKWVQEDKERWEFDNRYGEYSTDILKVAEKLGYLEEVHATQSHYTHAVVFGGLQPAVERRIAYLVEEWNRGVRFDHIVFLTGSRTLIAASEPLSCHPSAPKSEGDLLRLIYERAPMPEEMRKLPTTFVFSPKAPGECRATTASTILRWVNSKPTPGSCLIVSNQPLVEYQKTVAQALLPKTLTAEAIGYKPAAMPTAPLILDSIAQTIIWHSALLD